MVDFSVKISNDAGKKFDTNSLVARFKNLPVQTEPKSGADVLAANALIAYFEEKNLAVCDQTRRWLDLYFSERAGFYARSKSSGLGV